MDHRVPPRVQPIIQPRSLKECSGRTARMATEDSGRPFGRRGAGAENRLAETPASARACELATLVLDCRAEGWPAMNDLSAFDGRRERPCEAIELNDAEVER